MTYSHSGDGTHERHDGVAPQVRPAVDDGDVLHSLQRLQADLGAPLHGDQAVAGLALEVLRHHLAVGEVAAEGQRLLEVARAQVELAAIRRRRDLVHGVSVGVKVFRRRSGGAGSG
jgi:hypothetical protein